MREVMLLHWHLELKVRHKVYFDPFTYEWVSSGHVLSVAGQMDLKLSLFRFLATEESNAHPMYKKKLVEMKKTEYTNIFGRGRWPYRVLKTPFFMEWRNLASHENETNQHIIGHSTIHGIEKEIRKFAGTVPNKSTTGDIESMCLYAGEGVGLINDILPAAQVVKMLVEGAQKLIKQQFNS